MKLVWKYSKEEKNYSANGENNITYEITKLGRKYEFGVWENKHTQILLTDLKSIKNCKLVAEILENG